MPIDSVEFQLISVILLSGLIATVWYRTADHGVFVTVFPLNRERPREPRSHGTSMEVDEQRKRVRMRKRKEIEPGVTIPM